MSAPVISCVDAVLGCAIALDPVQELPGVQNRGYFIDAINAFCGSPLGSAWCMNFVHYVAVNTLGSARWPLGRDGNCDHVLLRARRDGIVRVLPKRGAVFLRINLAASSDAQHAGFVERVFGDGSWRSVEGNGAEDGSREGKAVVRITRGHQADAHRYVYVDWEALVR